MAFNHIILAGSSHAATEYIHKITDAVTLYQSEKDQRSDVARQRLNDATSDLWNLEKLPVADEADMDSLIELYYKFKRTGQGQESREAAKRAKEDLIMRDARTERNRRHAEKRARKEIECLAQRVAKLSVLDNPLTPKQIRQISKRDRAKAKKDEKKMRKRMARLKIS